MVARKAQRLRISGICNDAIKNGPFDIIAHFFLFSIPWLTRHNPRKCVHYDLFLQGSWRYFYSAPARSLLAALVLEREL